MTHHHDPTDTGAGHPAPGLDGAGTFEKYREMLRVSHRTLDAANIFTDVPSLLQAFLQIVTEYMGCGAASLRILDADGRVTHLEQSGFEAGDCALEKIPPDNSAECPCAAVVRGTTDAALPYFTDGGSFFTSGTHPCSACPRNRYASCALIPLRAWDSTLGLLHLADRRASMAPPDKIAVLESAAMQLSIAIQRTRAVCALRESRQNLKSVFDVIPDRILICDRERGILMSNGPQGRGGCGDNPGAGPLCLHVPGSRAGTCDGCRIRSVFDTARPVFEEVVDAADGSVRELRAFPVFDDAGRVQHVVGNIRDITDIKRGELLVQEAKQEAEFYLDLMTHDLTNYSQILLGNLLLFERFENPGPTGKKHLDTCRRQVAKIENLLAKVSAFSQVKNIDGSLPRTADINAMILESMKSLRTLYPKKNLEFEYAPRDEYMARGTDLLEHVILNVLENAVKHADKDPVRIGIRIDAVASDRGPAWEIRIEDNGPGVPDAMKTQIFERYSRVCREKKGSGLGLSLSRAIVEKLGGGIRVRDRVPGEPDQGSTFIITIPGASAP